MPDEWVEKIDALETASVSVSSAIAKTELSAATPISIKRGVATIEIRGTLVKKRSQMLDFFGIDQTAYEEIAEQTKAAVSKGAKKIVYQIDSPGGDANGILIGMDAIKNSGVPTEVIADGYLTSGAYMLASQADQILTANELVTVGSIGVATSRYMSKSIKDITNTDSKNKRPDVSKEEGVSVVEGELDDIYQVLAERIAEGRKTSIEAVKRDYGQGAMMTARTALSRKMIDGIFNTNNQPAQTKAATIIGVKAMNMDELKTEHPALYREVFALGQEAGRKEEKERVCAHLILAEGSGDIEAAHKAIQEDEGITELVKAQHMSAAMKRNMIAAREADNPPPINTNGGQPPVTEEEKFLAELKSIDKDAVWEVH
jgi:ClpP class serine protease